MDWSKIGNGAVFESLVSVIIIQEDVKARVYDRSGKDAAMDIKSGDGLCVYQAKYIGNQSFTTAISESLKELDKIKKYRQENHPNFECWADVKKWCLITNALWNPNDEKEWNKKVVQRFKEEGFEDVELWHHSTLVEKLTRYPHVKQEYFESENRVFISLSEAFKRLEDDRIALFAMGREFLGRKAELEAVEAFLEKPEKRVLPIHGPGGIGKSRFALEVSINANEKQAFDVYWANVESMAASTNWFQTFRSSRKTLLVIDEPNNRDSLRILFEQINSERLSNTKVLVITRSPKDPVLQVLRNPRSKALEDELELKELLDDDIVNVTENLLAECTKLKNAMGKDLKIWAQRIGRISNGFPMWATLAVYLLNAGKSINDLPDDEYGIAQLYVEEILKHVPRELNGNEQTFKEFLQWLALFQPFYYESEQELLDYIVGQLNLKNKNYLKTLFTNLIKRKVCKKRGRLIEIKPDVIRDHILYEWLGKNEGNAEELVNEFMHTKNFPHPKEVLRQLGRLELTFKLKGEEFSVLEPFISELKNLAKNGTLLNQYNVLKYASECCLARPIDLVEISRILRTNKRDNEKLKDELWGEFEISHEDLVLKLPWEIFTVGRYSSQDEELEEVFSELISLARYEFRQEKYEMNDGERAANLLQRLLPGGQEQQRAFDKIAYRWIEQKLNDLNAIKKDEWNVFNRLTETILSIEREDFFSGELSIHISMYYLPPNSEADKMRRKVRLKLWEIVTSQNIELEKRKMIWRLLIGSQSELRKALAPRERNIDQFYTKYWENELRENLERVLKILQNGQAPLTDLNEMKEIWDWHCRNEKNDKLKNLAVKCQDAMNSNSETSTLNKLFDYELYQEKSKISAEIAQSLDSKEKIFDFFSRANDFARNFSHYWEGVSEVAHNVGKDRFDASYVKQYVNEVLHAESFNKPQIHAACEIIAAQTKIVREKNPQKLPDTFFQLYTLIRNSEAKHIFFNSFYIQPHPRARGLLIDEDLDIILKIIHTKSYPNEIITSLFYVLGYMFYIDFDKIKQTIDSLWGQIEDSEAINSYFALVNGIYYRTIFSKDFPIKFPLDFFEWLIGLLNNVADLSEIRNLFISRLNLIQKKTGQKLDVCWFYTFFKERVEKIDKGILKNGSYSFPEELFNSLKPISKADGVKKSVVNSFKELLQFYHHESMLRIYLPKILNHLDPHGIIVPDLVAKKIRACEFQKQEDPTENECYKLIRYAAYYSINSDSWRLIAIEACKLVRGSTDEQRKKVYSALLNKHFNTCTGVGKNALSSRYAHEIAETQKDLEAEKEEILMDLMKYRLEVAKKSLAHEKQIEEEMEY